MDQIKMEPTWKARLGEEFNQPYMQDLRSFLLQQKQQGKKIFPRGDQYFAAFEKTPFEKVKVVILGQDPYHGEGEAHGLCFSVPEGVAIPPSLLNIYKELQADLGIPLTRYGNLQKWADQGVLLLNSILTVEKDKAASHREKGWEQFTDRVIAKLNEERSNVVFLLWGSYAQKKGAFIDRKKHLVLESPHPSPLSAHRGFFGSKPFSKINQFLLKTGQEPIDWNPIQT